MILYVLEVGIVDHPDYETFVDVFLDEEDAINTAKARCNETAEACGIEPKIEVIRISERQIRINLVDADCEDDLVEWYFITRREAK